MGRSVRLEALARPYSASLPMYVESAGIRDTLKRYLAVAL